MTLQIRRLSHALGAEIGGIDIRKPLDDKTFSEIHTTFLEHHILLFRGQPLTRAQHVAFSRRFGELYADEARGKMEFREIYVNRTEVNSNPAEIVGESWHSDLHHKVVPAMASLLRGVEIPEVGGDTLFANMYLAYESLSDGMKKLIEGLYAIHPRLITAKNARAGEDLNNPPSPVAHPLVRVHPETGRKALYVGEECKYLAGMTENESKPLIQFLWQHAIRPQFVYRHVWRKDDLLVWDNRCLMHRAVGDYDRAYVRQTERTIVRGTPSGYVYDGPPQ